MNRVVMAAMILALLASSELVKALSPTQESHLKSTIEILDSELDAIRAADASAYDLTMDLCYIFQFRKKHNLPLVTELTSVPQEDAHLVLSIPIDPRLRRSLGAWMRISANGALFRYEAQQRFTVTGNYRRAIEDCSRDVGTDLREVMDREMELAFSSSNVASMIISTYGLGKLFGLFKLSRAKAVSLTAGTTVIGLYALYSDQKESIAMQKEVQARTNDLAVQQQSADEIKTQKMRELDFSVRQFAIRYLEEIARDDSHHSADLNRHARDLKPFKSALASRYEQNVERIRFLTTDSSPKSAGEAKQLAALNASIVLYMKFIGDGG